MTPRDGALLLVILGSAVSLLAALRSLRVPPLRPVVVACGAFVLLDAARWVGLPWAADVVAFVVMPGCWAALLASRVTERSGLSACVGSVSEHGQAQAPGEGSGALRPSFRQHLTLFRQVVPRHPRILARLLPPALCLLYAAALLAARHHPAVRAHWTAALQAPRIAGLALAVWVGLRWRKDEGPAPAKVTGPYLPLKVGGPEDLNDGAATTFSDRGQFAPVPASPQPPLLVGLTMALGAGLAAAWGLWGPSSWWQVQILAAACWLIAGAVVARAR